MFGNFEGCVVIPDFRVGPETWVSDWRKQAKLLRLGFSVHSVEASKAIFLTVRKLLLDTPPGSFAFNHVPHLKQPRQILKAISGIAFYRYLLYQPPPL
jgi:hypothetical protein